MTEVMESMEVTSLRRRSALKMHLLLIRKRLALVEPGVKQIIQYLRASLAVYMQALEDSRVQAIFFHLFPDRNNLVTLLNSARVFHFVIKIGQAKLHTPFENEGSDSARDTVVV